MPNIAITKFLAAPSTTAIGTISSAATPVITFVTSAFTTQQRLSFWSSATALSSQSIVTLVGTNESGATITETIVPSTVVNTPNITAQDFLSVSSVTINGVPNSIVNIGLSSIGSTPWQIANSLASPFNIGFNLVYGSSTATTTGSLEYTLADPKPVFFPATSSTFRPSAFVSTAISTTGITTPGLINFPITAWRFTLNSTNSSASNVATLYAVPAGLGS